MNIDQRVSTRQYHRLLPEFYPAKLIGAFISADFVVGCRFKCDFCISKRHPAREALFDQGLVIDNRVSPKKMHAWFMQMPSFRAGVQIRIGHDTDAGLQFEKSAKLIEMVGPEHSITYLSRKPLNAKEQAFFGRYRDNLLLKFTATPRSDSLHITRDPLKLLRSAEKLDPRMLYWVVGPLVRDNQREAFSILEALPSGSTLFLKELNYAGLPSLSGVTPISKRVYSELEKYALRRGLFVSEWFCRSGLERVGQGFFDVDKITEQEDSEKKERELSYCKGCKSEELCHSEVDDESLYSQLAGQLSYLGLNLTAPPKKVGPRSFNITVDKPSSRGEETYLNHIISPRVSIVVNTREKGRSQGGSFSNIEPAVLKRWYESGFFPVAELNNIAANIMADVERLSGSDFWSKRDWQGDGKC